MVCYMYYTDVFVGSVNNINSLKNALEAELSGFNNSNDLTQLVQGLCLFMGYPSCVCSLKANVDKSLQDISEKLKEDFKAVQSCVNLKPLNLNCSCNSKDILCKCCVISCIKELRDKSKSQCDCVKNTTTDCKCQEPNGKCCKDFLSGLEACLSLLNLKTDLQDCTCDTKNCCESGTCNNKCPVCDPKISTITGLGLSRPNPVRLAKRLSEMLCGTQKARQCSCGCGCNSGASNTSCCCFCHSDCKTGKFSGECSKACPGCSCSKSGGCGLQNFCKSINTIKVLVGSKEMTCCDGGKNCHCVSDSGSKCSGSNCCVVSCSTNGHYQHSVKCMILRVVKFFKDFPLDASVSSSQNCSKICCELICVGKYCVFLKMFYDKGGKDVCSKCKSGGSSGKCPGSTLQSPSNNCCNGTDGCKSGDCCLGCQDCDAIKFRKALEDLKLSSPCGQDLWRVLNDFLDYCLNVAEPFIKSVKDKIEEAKEKCQTCKQAGTSKKPCSCSQTSGSCLGCQEIRDNHKDIMSVLTRKFSSSYNSSNANWDSLCSPGSKCCGSSPCSCTSGSCPPQGCCEKCPKRLCAKIFLGFIPALYFGLKIVYERCQDPVTWPDWHDISMDSYGNPSSGLAKFLYAWGYDLDPLKTKKGFEFSCILENLYGSGKFKSLLDFVSKKYFSKTLPSSPCSSSCPSPSGSSSHVYPSTVRSILLWLSGLPFSKGFNALLSHSKGLCPPSEKSLNSDEFLYCIHVSCFFVPVSVISAIQHPGASKSFLPSTSDWTSFCYPEDPFDLFNMLFENVRKVYIPLNFLRYQCERITEHGGWKDCAFGQSCVTALQSSLSTSTPNSSCCNPSSLPHGILCTSVPGESNYHEHCTSSKPEVKCIGLEKCNQKTGSDPTDAHSSGGTKCKASCPHPLLMFLIDGSLGSDPGKSYSLFKLPPDSSVPPMGFESSKLSSTARHGSSLHDVLNSFCGSSSLTSLLKFLTRVSRHPPETLGEFFLFFKKLAEALNSEPLKTEFPNYVTGEPGFYSGSDLKKAIQNLYGSSHSSSSHTPASLYSLNDCEGPRGSSPPHPTCGKYLHPLAQDASDNFVEDLVDTYLSWACYLTPKFKTLLEEFQGKFSSCCSTGSCSSIVKCPCALATLYSQGFVYYSPSGLGCWNSWGEEHKARGGVQDHESEKENSPHCTRKTCKNFIEQLGLVVDSDSPLQKLLDAIDAFIWSIRLPFFLFVLAFWAFVMSYFLYVQLYKLDFLHLKSHAHFSRSFKILPSTLFSDASSKLKDLTYFTL